MPDAPSGRPTKQTDLDRFSHLPAIVLTLTAIAHLLLPAFLPRLDGLAARLFSPSGTRIIVVAHLVLLTLYFGWLNRWKRRQAHITYQSIIQEELSLKGVHAEGLAQVSHLLLDGVKTWRQTADLLPIGIMIVDLQGIVYWANRASSQMLAMPSEQLVGLSSESLEHVLGWPMQIPSINQLVRRKLCEPTTLQTRFRQSEIRIEAHKTKSLEQKNSGLILFLHDITQQVAEEAEAKRQTQLLDALPTAIISLDSSGNLNTFNKGAEELFDVERGTVLNKPLPKHLTDTLPALAEGVETAGFTLTIGEKDHAQTLSITTKQLYDYERRSFGTLCLLEDMTKQKQLTEKLRSNERLATIGQMAAGTVHEIRNPLAAARGYIQLLLMQSSDDSHTEYADLALVEIDRIGQILQEFLLLSKAVSPDLRKLDLGAILHDTIELLSAALSKSSIKLVIKRWQPVDALGDRFYIQQVLYHLIHNAVEATPPGGSIYLSLYPLGEIARIIIEDTGIGMDEAALSRCFDPFYSTKESGVGLGLTVCQRLMEEMNGQIELSSQPLHGTTVRLTLSAYDELVAKKEAPLS